jgi:hypothetical protein
MQQIFCFVGARFAVFWLTTDDRRLTTKERWFVNSHSLFRRSSLVHGTKRSEQRTMVVANFVRPQSGISSFGETTARYIFSCTVRGF